MSAYDEALATLYRAAFGEFVAERKRLAGELKAAGDKAGSALLLKLARPPISVWAVNQLWWREREAFEALIRAASQVKVGDREAGQRHREALGKLRERGTQILLEGGNGASEQTLRRVTTTLSAVAATGGFEPDAPGALSADREPPGFEALGFGAATSTSVGASSSATTSTSTPGGTNPAVEAAALRAAEAERRRAEAAERERRLAERERLSAALRDAQALRETQQHELGRLRSELDSAEQGLRQTQALLAKLEQQLANL